MLASADDMVQEILSHVLTVEVVGSVLPHNFFNIYHPKTPYTIFTIKVVGSVFCSCRIIQCSLDTIRDKRTVRRGLSADEITSFG